MWRNDGVVSVVPAVDLELTVSALMTLIGDG